MENFVRNNLGPDQMPYCVPFVLGLHCLPMSLLQFSRLEWVNLISVHNSVEMLRYEGMSRSLRHWILKIKRAIFQSVHAVLWFSGMLVADLVIYLR